MYSKYQNILILQKKSKLNYLLEKYGKKLVESSPEYEKMKESMNYQTYKSAVFVEKMLKYANSNQKVKIITDCFQTNEQVSNRINNLNYDTVITLGGDGTFLRCARLLEDIDTTLIGVNSDDKRSRGFYCSLSVDDNIDVKIRKLLNKEVDFKHYHRLQVDFKKSKERYFFINDLYFGEKFLGRISKYNLKFDNNDIEHSFKSSGVIFSTCKYSYYIFIFILYVYILIDQGYSGWIKNANTVSYNKFETLFPNLSQEEILNKYVNKEYEPNYQIEKNEDKIFYYVREPNLLKPQKICDKYHMHLKKCEGIADTISLKNYCFEGTLIMDGSFTMNVDYDEELDIKIGTDRLRSIKKMI